MFISDSFDLPDVEAVSSESFSYFVNVTVLTGDSCVKLCYKSSVIGLFSFLCEACVTDDSYCCENSYDSDNNKQLNKGKTLS